MADSQVNFAPVTIASRRAAVPTPAHTAPPGPQPNASKLTSVVARPSTAAVAKKRNAVRAPLLPLDPDARAAMAVTLRSLGLSEAAGGRISQRAAATRAAVA